MAQTTNLPGATSGLPEAAVVQLIKQYVGSTPALIAQLQGEVRATQDRLLSGTGSPENVVAAKLGTLYVSETGGTSTTLYVKEGGGSGNTGWIAK